MESRSMSHRPVNVGKNLGHSENGGCHSKQDCTQHIALGQAFASAVRADFPVLVVVMSLCFLPSAVLMV